MADAPLLGGSTAASDTNNNNNNTTGDINNSDASSTSIAVVWSSLQHLHCGVPTPLRRAPTVRTPASQGVTVDGVDGMASAAHSSVDAALDHLRHEADLAHAAHAAADHAYALFCEREIDWESNRTTDLPLTLVNDLRVLGPPTPAPAALLHHLPDAERQALVQAMRELADLRRAERAQLEQQRVDERLREKVRRKQAREEAKRQAALETEEADRRLERERRKLRRSGRFSQSEHGESESANTKLTPESLVADVLASLPGDATPCSHCPASPCHLLTLPAYTHSIPLHPTSLTAFHFELPARNLSSHVLAVRLHSTAAPCLVTFQPAPLFYVQPMSSHLIGVDYVGEWLEECARLSDGGGGGGGGESGESVAAPHSLLVSTRILRRQDLASGFAARHPALVWTDTDATHDTHTFEVRLRWTRGDGSQNNVPGADEAVYQRLRQKEAGQEAVRGAPPASSPSPSLAAVSSVEEGDSVAPLPHFVSHDGARRTRTARCKTMVSLRAMRESIAADLHSPPRDFALTQAAATVDVAPPPSSSPPEIEADFNRAAHRRSGRLRRSLQPDESAAELSLPLPSSLHASTMLDRVEADLQRRRRRGSSEQKEAASAPPAVSLSVSPFETLTIAPLPDSTEDRSIQTALTWLGAVGPVDAQAVLEAALAEHAAEEADYATTADDTSLDGRAASPHAQLEELLQEWEQCVRNAEQRRRQEGERIAAVRAESDGGGGEWEDEAAELQLQYFTAELVALDYERDTLMRLECDLKHKAMMLNKKLFDSPRARPASAACPPQALDSASPAADGFEARHARLRERAIRLEAVRAQHRMFLTDELGKAPRGPRSPSGASGPPMPAGPLTPQSFFSSAELRRTPALSAARSPLSSSKCLRKSTISASSLNRLASVYGSRGESTFVALKLPRSHFHPQLRAPAAAAHAAHAALHSTPHTIFAPTSPTSRGSLLQPRPQPASPSRSSSLSSLPVVVATPPQPRRQPLHTPLPPEDERF